MTKSQAIHHQEQIEAARAEFNQWWTTEFTSIRMPIYVNGDKTQHQITAWRARLKAKGLLLK